MAGGDSALGFGSGFARGFAGQMLRNTERKREDARAEEDKLWKRLQLQIPMAQQQAEATGDYSWLQDLMVEADPSLKKAIEKGQPFQMIAQIGGGQKKLQAPVVQAGSQGPNVPQGAMPMTPADQTAGQALPQPIGAPSQAEPLQNRSNIQPMTPPKPESMFLGQAMPSPEDKAIRQLELRRTMGQRAGLKPEEMPYFLTDSQPLPRAGVPTQNDFTLGPNQIRFDEKGKEIAKGPAQATPRGTSSDYDEGLARYMVSIGKPGVPASTQDEMAYNKMQAESRRAPGQAAGTDVSAAARLAVRNPAVLAGLTPTARGAVINAIASDPDLSRQFETKRMEPVREKANSLLTALDKLVITDPNSGEVTGLTTGAQQLYGNLTPPWMREMNPMGDAADANAALKQLVGQQIIDMLAELKAQSQSGATGFGQLNIRELDTIMSAATQLRGRLTEGTALEQLKALREKIVKMTLPGVAESPGNITVAPGAGAALERPMAAPARTVGQPYQDAQGNWVIP